MSQEEAFRLLDEQRNAVLESLREQNDSDLEKTESICSLQMQANRLEEEHGVEVDINWEEVFPNEQLQQQFPYSPADSPMGENFDFDEPSFDPVVETLSNNWEELLPKLVDCYILSVKNLGVPKIFAGYEEMSFGYTCSNENCGFSTKPLNFFCTRFVLVNDFKWCNCKSLSQALMLCGFLPSSPMFPKSAVHLGMLSNLNMLRNHLGASGQALADYYNAVMGNPENGISHKICQNLLPLYSRLLLLVDSAVDYLAATCSLQDNECPACPQDGFPGTSNSTNNIKTISLDGCFSMKCLKSKDDSLHQTPVPAIEKMWVKQSTVDFYEKERASRDVLASENTHRASGQTASLKSKVFPVKGLFAASCGRHEYVLKLSDMATGEGFKYSLAMIKELLGNEDGAAVASRIPKVILYDIACLLEPSLKKHFEDQMEGTGGWSLAVPAFHAFAHVLHCQAKRNPRFMGTIGRTDGESLERFWSYLKPFINMTRPMNHPNRRVVLTMATLHRNQMKKWNMGKFLKTKYQKASKALEEIKALGGEALVAHSHLHRHNWDLQVQRMAAGKSCASIWSQFDDGVNKAVRYYVLQSVHHRFSTSNSERLYVGSSSFLASDLSAIKAEMNELLVAIRAENPNFVAVPEQDLTPEVLNFGEGYYQEYLRLKRIMFVDCLREHVQAYKGVVKRLKHGGLGTSLAGKCKEARNVHKKHILYLLAKYKEEAAKGNLGFDDTGFTYVSFEDLVDEENGFWGPDVTESVRLYIDYTNVVKEMEMLRCEIVNLLHNARAEVDENYGSLAYLEHKASDPNDEHQALYLGAYKLMKNRLDQSIRWRERCISILLPTITSVGRQNFEDLDDEHLNQATTSVIDVLDLTAGEDPDVVITEEGSEHDMALAQMDEEEEDF
ncbi:uncharacterized protein EV154DRAFT_579325 [Mucor mucedo]|uniref:CxC1-like cysteine cluster associated with KDZ transposases domain-containing protein n=1 Tax=Mucor saturninus TaxID=64648 RepID=A0A8H7QDG0_9FUNG|nr:uncharacterized protein EV154DRAFT_579325 [Mucor mucedo]KAG2190859.1 hypothetical protein INT47_007011 [Mucor saturninus]KAI7894329.1 hypothetical protein EV154DRAFT_579325 [Mucor mucedo]